VNTVRAMALTSNQAQQGFPGSFVVHQHQLTNTGNIPETSIALKTEDDQGTPAPTTDFNGWTSLVYLDDGDGIAEFGAPISGTTSDTQIPLNATLNAALPSGIAPGASVTLWVKVNVPAGATQPTQNVTTLTATPTPTVNTVAHAAMVNTDTTSVMSGRLELIKKQALDLNCDGDTLDSGTTLVPGVTFPVSVSEVAFTQDEITANAVPGSCILYQITATNVGNVNVTNVVINDVTPANTKMESTAGPMTPAISGTPGLVVAPITAVSVTAPADGAAGNISTTTTPLGGFTITPSGNAVLTFGVKVN